MSTAAIPPGYSRTLMFSISESIRPGSGMNMVKSGLFASGCGTPSCSGASDAFGHRNLVRTIFSRLSTMFHECLTDQSSIFKMRHKLTRVIPPPPCLYHIVRILNGTPGEKSPTSFRSLQSQSIPSAGSTRSFLLASPPTCRRGVLPV